MRIIHSSSEKHSPRDLAFTNEGMNGEKHKGLLPKNGKKKLIVPISNSFQKKTQSVDIVVISLSFWLRPAVKPLVVPRPLHVK